MFSLSFPSDAVVAGGRRLLLSVLEPVVDGVSAGTNLVISKISDVVFGTLAKKLKTDLNGGNII